MKILDFLKHILMRAKRVRDNRSSSLESWICTPDRWAYAMPKSLMPFFGRKVTAGNPQKVFPKIGSLHITRASLATRGSKNVIVFVTIGGKSLTIGTLSPWNNIYDINLDIYSLPNREVEISIEGDANAEVHIMGYYELEEVDDALDDDAALCNEQHEEQISSTEENPECLNCFFGVEVTVGRSQKVNLDMRSLLITQAALATPTSNKVALSATIDGKSFTIGALSSSHGVYHMSLDTRFQPNSELDFFVEGDENAKVHIMGYYEVDEDQSDDAQNEKGDTGKKGLWGRLISFWK